jgi:hypothetical protein
LRERLERAEDERSELRRMLFLEQQTVANLRAQLPPPRDTDAPTTHQGTPPQAPPDIDRHTLHGVAHELERRRPWWWLPRWRKGK